MPEAGREPLVLVVSGPSGAGKSTLVRRLLELDGGARLSVSATTRAKRPGETDGVDYRFISEEEFRRMVGAGEFLEHAEVFGSLYGTPRFEVDSARADGVDLVLEIDIEGARQVRVAIPEAVLVFVLPPSPEELENRLRARATDSDDAVGQRLARVKKELKAAQGQIVEAPKYDYLVTNDEVGPAAERLRAVLVAERCRPERTEAWAAWKRMTSTS